MYYTLFKEGEMMSFQDLNDKFRLTKIILDTYKLEILSQKNLNSNQILKPEILENLLWVYKDVSYQKK